MPRKSKPRAGKDQGGAESPDLVKKPKGRPAHEPTPDTRRQVRAMVGFGTTHENAAKVLGICKNTLEKHYRTELDLAEIEANAQVAQSLYRKATGYGPASVTAAIFWMKCRAGWKEPAQVHEVSGPGGGPMAPPIINFVRDPDPSTHT